MRRNVYVTLIGNYGCANYGDDILLHCLLMSLHEKVPEGKICVLADRSDYLQHWYPNVKFVSNTDCDVIDSEFLIYGGGTQFFSFGNEQTQRKHKIANLRHYLLNPVRIVQRLKRQLKGHTKIRANKIGAISLGVGPFVQGSHIEDLAKSTLARCEWLSVRDSVSHQWLLKNNITNGQVHADLGFVKGPWFPKCQNQHIRSTKLKNIGVVVRDWPHSKNGMNYFRNLYQAVQQMREEYDYNVQFISFAGTYDKEVQQILRSKGETVLAWDPCHYTIKSFADQLMFNDIIISSRAHGVVVASMLGIPNIAIEIEPKLKVIREYLNSGSIGWPAPFNSNELLQTVQAIGSNLTQESHNLSIDVQKCSISANTSITKLIQWMGLI